MALSAETIALLRRELAEELCDGRIEKIQQPERDLLLLTIRAGGENKKLLIRASGPNARIHLTRRRYENPKDAPMFCMMLRKQLGGARIRDIEQPGGDRLLLFRLEGRSEMGDVSQLTLAAEFLGRSANLILADGEGRILDSLRRVPLSENGGRALLPGLRYELPSRPSGLSGKPAQGMSADALDTLPLPTDAELPSVSAELDSRYGDAEQTELQRRRAQELLRTVRRLRDRQQRKLVLQKEELRRTENLDAMLREAELLQANLYRVHRGDRMLECEDYYEEDCPTVRLQLDPLKTPQENLAARFRSYRKAKGTQQHLTGIVSEGEKLLDYLNSVLDEIGRTESEKDLDEIRGELLSAGIMKPGKNQRGGRKQKRQDRVREGEPLAFPCPGGFEALVGRNNLQNDSLTGKIARRTDYWLHVKQLHGSHVILRCEGREPTQEALRFAAELAAFYSQARDSGRTAVDYTMVRNVRKPSGALPGRVIYDHYQTILVQSGGPELERAGRAESDQCT